MTFLEMCLNIKKKFGKDSAELKIFKDYYIFFQDKPHVVRRVYQMIMTKS